jgi:hypothetical protein
MELLICCIFLPPKLGKNHYLRNTQTSLRNQENIYKYSLRLRKEILMTPICPIWDSNRVKMRTIAGKKAMKSNKIKQDITQIEGNRPTEETLPNHAEIPEKSSDCDGILVNLLAEIITENIVRKIRNGCNRIHKDQ